MKIAITMVKSLNCLCELTWLFMQADLSHTMSLSDILRRLIRRTNEINKLIIRCGVAYHPLQWLNHTISSTTAKITPFYT